MNKPIIIIVHVRGGVVQEVEIPHTLSTPKIEVLVRDYDLDTPKIDRYADPFEEFIWTNIS